MHDYTTYDTLKQRHASISNMLVDYYDLADLTKKKIMDSACVNNTSSNKGNNKDFKLRKLVGHANLLDKIMDDIDYLDNEKYTLQQRINDMDCISTTTDKQPLLFNAISKQTTNNNDNNQCQFKISCTTLSEDVNVVDEEDSDTDLYVPSTDYIDSTTMSSAYRYSPKIDDTGLLDTFPRDFISVVNTSNSGTGNNIRFVPNLDVVCELEEDLC